MQVKKGRRRGSGGVAGGWAERSAGSMAHGCEYAQNSVNNKNNNGFGRTLNNVKDSSEHFLNVATQN